MGLLPQTALGIDVGGTKIAAAIVTFPGGRIHARRQIPTNPERGSQAVLGDVVQLTASLLGGSDLVGSPSTAIGIGLCELVSPDGRILSGNCVRWRAETVAALLEPFGTVTLEADVRAAARAEALLGAGRRFRSFLYVTVGTGISCCLMADGKPYLGARGATGTLASSALRVPCAHCGTLNLQTLEDLASGPGLVHRLNRLQPGSAHTARDVFAAVAKANKDARQVVQTACEALGSAVGLMVNVLDPEAVILGGGLAQSEDFLWDDFLEGTRRHIWSEVHRDLPIVRAETGIDAGVIGAAWSALQPRARSLV